MAVTIIATAGSASANSFTTLAELTTYMEARLNSTLFDAASTDTKNRALVEATREVSVLNYKGYRAETTQALSWPRWDAPNPDSAQGWLYDTDEIPQRVKDATMELANQFIIAGTTDIASAPTDPNVIEKTIDVITTRWSEYTRTTGVKLYPRVWALLAPLLEGSVNQMQVVRG